MRLVWTSVFVLCAICTLSQGQNAASSVQKRSSRQDGGSQENLENVVYKGLKSFESELKSKDDDILRKIDAHSKDQKSSLQTLRLILSNVEQKVNKMEKDLDTSAKTRDSIETMLRYLKTPPCVLWKENLGRAEVKKLKSGNYHFNTNTDATWKEARNFCFQIGMDLASFETDEELREVLEAAPIKNSKGYWLAASDAGRKPGEFHWMDGRVVNQSMWAKNEPSSFAPRKATCALLWPKVEKLSDAGCDRGAFFICEVTPENLKCV